MTERRKGANNVTILNGKRYDIAIDNGIISALSDSEKVSSACLKKRVEEILIRTIADRTWYSHILRLQNETLLKKEDSGKRGTQAVFYSLTEEARIRKKLRLLRTDPKYNIFKQIYFHIFKALTIPGLYCVGESDLDQRLTEICSCKKDMILDHISKEFTSIDGLIESRGRPVLRVLPCVTIFHYKPISNVYITKTISYREDIETHHVMEYDEGSYDFQVPGISTIGFSNRSTTFRPDFEDIREAFDLLLKSSLIIPKILFLGETRYVLSDNALLGLLTDFKLIDNIESELNYMKWNHYTKHTNEDILQREIFYSDERDLEIDFNKRELLRYEFRRRVKEREGKKEWLKLRKQAEGNIRKTETAMEEIIKCLRQKHMVTLKQYSFLSDIFEAHYPSLF